MELRKLLINEKERLLNAGKIVRDRMKDAPQGKLRLGKSQGCVRYFYIKEGERKGIYIPKKEEELAKRLAQKSYDEKVLRLVEKRLPQIEKILKDYEENEIEKIYLKEHIARRKFIEPVEQTYEQKLVQWLSHQFKGKQFKMDTPVILSNNGLRVRSKSEKILADFFDSMGIPFKYECPLELEGYGVVYPDFTFLSRKTGKEIYWEHEGMMDNPNYAESAVKKIEMYENNGIFPGDQLILSFETSATAINMQLVRTLVEKHLM
ncbi:MAG: hypothetical protein K6G85_09230 [Eubacterium sp.]|nr:hypothetical protein [Eubacterium sp.]